MCVSGWVCEGVCVGVWGCVGVSVFCEVKEINPTKSRSEREQFLGTQSRRNNYNKLYLYSPFQADSVLASYV